MLTFRFIPTELHKLTRNCGRLPMREIMVRVVQFNLSDYIKGFQTLNILRQFHLDNNTTIVTNALHLPKLN